MKRSSLLALLQAYHPVYREEQEFKHQIVDFVLAYQDCFERTLSIGHITASAWLLNKQGTHALLMHHSKLDRWFQLGGHCDGDSDVLAVAMNEAQEESGINGIVAISADIFDIDVHLIPANSREVAHYHYDIRFLLQVVSDELIARNHESKQLLWIEKGTDALPTQSPSVVRMFHKWVNRIV